MTVKDYAEILKWAIKTQIGYKEETLAECDAMNEDYVSGIITGLHIALDKIEASMFLAKE